MLLPVCVGWMNSSVLQKNVPFDLFFSVRLLGNEVIGVDSADVRASVHCLHIIDNQQTLFKLSHKLEPRA